MLSKSYAKITHLSFCLVAVLGVCAWPAAVWGAVDVGVRQSTAEQIVLEYAVRDFVQQAVVIEGEAYLQLGLAGETVLKQRGAPELPHICRSVIIPAAARMEVQVVRAQYYDLVGVDVAPSKGFISRTVKPADVPYVFGDVYGQDAFWPAEVVQLGQPYVMRDLRGLVVEVIPFQYNPVTHTLRVYTELEVEVFAAGPDQVNLLTPRPDRELSRAFHQIYKHHFINYFPEERYEPLDEVGNMLVIYHDAWAANIQPFVDHKNAIGIETSAVPVGDIGNNATAIKNYIQDVYDSSDLAFVLLVGDGAQVDTPYASGGASDPTYSKLAGGDSYPDIIVGRFSAENPGHVDTQVLRTIEYEINEATQTAWFKKGVGVASNQGPGDDGEYDNQHIGLIRDWLLAYGYTHVDEIYDPYGTAGQVTAALNDGRGIINYCGHGSTTSWGSTGFDNGDVDALVNDNMLPFIVSVACVNGNFDGPTCFAEAWLRATHDGEPTGAIGAYMSSINQSWNPPMEGQDEFNLLLTSEAYMSYGALCFAGSCSMMDEYGSGGVSMFDTWHIFGDPSVRVFGVVDSSPVKIKLVGEPPIYIPPVTETMLTLSVEDGKEAYVPDTAMLHYRYGPGPFTATPLVAAGDIYYTATLPPPVCGDNPEYYFTAEGDEGSLVYFPKEAPMANFTVTVATVTVVLQDDFEMDQGWTVDSVDLETGAWERGVPSTSGDHGEPVEDFDGSGQCFVTGLAEGNNDVDGGPTRLVTPMLDLSGKTDPVVRFAYWLANDDMDVDAIQVQLSNSGGAMWMTACVFACQEEPLIEWTEFELKVADYISLTNQVKLRFAIADNPNNSVTEAGIDAVEIFDVACAMPGLGDMNCDGGVDFRDINPFVLALTDPTAWEAAYPGCSLLNGDVNGDGEFGFADINPFVLLLSGR